VRQRIATAVALLVLATGCTGSDPGEPEARDGSPTRASTAQPSPTQDPSERAPTTPAPTTDADEPTPDEAPFQADRRRDTAEHEGGRLSPVDLRVGRHDGYDRVVLELAGSGRPGWFAEYVDEPRNQGRGDRADVRGQHHLELMVTGVQYPMEEGAQEYRGPREVTPDGLPVVAEVEVGALYEGYQQVFIGISSEREPFRVFRLADPPRVVVDVQHPR